MEQLTTNPFKTLPALKMVEKFRPAVYMDDPDKLASVLMYAGRVAYSVPVEVARMIHRQLGMAIYKAERVNDYKATWGSNPCDMSEV